MKKLTAEKCRYHIDRLQGYVREGYCLSLIELDTLKAFEIAMPVLEKQESTPQIDNDGWIEWLGGDCPVPVNVMVEYKMRDGWVGSCFADDLRWRNASNPREYPAADIIAYRVIENDGRKG